MKHIYILVVGLCCLSACKQVPEISSGNVLIKDSLQTHVDRNAFFGLTTLKSSTGVDSLLQLFNYNEKYFLVYDMISKQQVDSVNIRDYTLDGDSRAGRNIRGIVYILESSEKLIRRIDPKAKKIDSFRYNDEQCYSLTIDNVALSVLDDSFVYLQVNPKGRRLNEQVRLEHLKSRPVAKMVMRDKKLVVLGTYCPFPESYANGDFKDDDAVIYASSPDELWYAFSDASRFYHVQNGQEEVIETGYPFVPLEKIQLDSLRSISFVKRYQIRNMHVSRLEYLPGQQQVHLYCKPPAPVLDSNGELNRYNDCANYLLAYDLKKPRLRQYLIPKRVEYINGVSFKDKLIWTNDRDDNEFLTLYTIKLQ